MVIDERQLVGKPKKIGTLDGSPVVEIVTKGGLNLVATASKGIIGSGPHRAVARHIAMKQNPELKLTELSKADWVPEDSYRHLLPKYEALTLRLQRK